MVLGGGLGGLVGLDAVAPAGAGALASWANVVVQQSTSPSATGAILLNNEVCIFIWKLFGFGQLRRQLIGVEPVFIGEGVAMFDGPKFGTDPDNHSAV